MPPISRKIATTGNQKIKVGLFLIIIKPLDLLIGIKYPLINIYVIKKVNIEVGNFKIKKTIQNKNNKIK